MSIHFRTLIDLQLHGVSSASLEPTRRGGAGPSGMRAFMLDGHCVMLPVGAQAGAFHAMPAPTAVTTTTPPDAALHAHLKTAAPVATSAGTPAPTNTKAGDLVLHTAENAVRLSAVPTPHFYALQTADGIPYRQIALLHGSDCLASTVVQQCSRYARPEQRCRFCALGETLASGATILRKTPEQLAEVAEAAQKLDHVTHVTLTSGTAAHRDAGIRYLGECARAITERTGLPVQIQFEPPEDLHIFTELKAMGVANVSMHVESLDENVRRRITPGKAAISLKEYFAAFAAAVAVFGRNRVGTYVILGLGEDKAVTLARCRELAKLGVYPSLVPLRPLPHTFMAKAPAPGSTYLRDMYSAVGAALRDAGLSSEGCAAGCGRCRACSLLQFTERGTLPREDIAPDAGAHPAQRTCALHTEESSPLGIPPLAQASSPFTQNAGLPARTTSPSARNTGLLAQSISPRTQKADPLAQSASLLSQAAAKDFTPAAVTMLVASTPEELAACHAVRQAVFVEEQGIFPEDDTDEHDADAVHILALVDGEIAGVVRCFRLHGDIWHGGRLAVLRRFRSHLGALLVHKAVEVMRGRADVRRFFATVQVQNVRFFRRLHWKGLGHTFLYNGCKHQLMERALHEGEDTSRVTALRGIRSVVDQAASPLPHCAVASSDCLFPAGRAE